jgi:hypothetical protein
MAEILHRQEIIYERERERERPAATAITNRKKVGKKQEKIWGKVGKKVHIIIMHINQSINVAIIIYPIQDTQFFFLSLSHTTFILFIKFLFLFLFKFYFNDKST